MYDIVDSLSRISKSETCINSCVTRVCDSCKPDKAMFFIFMSMVSLNSCCLPARTWDIRPGSRISIIDHQEKNSFWRTFLKDIWTLYKEGLPISNNGANGNSRIIAIPFHIRNEPFGLLMLGKKSGRFSTMRTSSYSCFLLKEQP